jgi:hypothetical protein
MNIEKSKYNYSIIALVIFNVLTIYYFASRGLDLSDQGYLISIKNIFKPEYGSFLGSLITIKVFEYCFGNYTFIATKISAQLLPLILIVSYYNLFKKGNKFFLLISLLLYIWVTRSSLNEWLYYTNISSFLISLAILLLAKCAYKNNYYIYFLSLILLELACFTLITRVVYFLLIPLFILLQHIFNKDWQTTKKLALLFLIFIISNFTVLLLLTIYSSGFYDYIVNYIYHFKGLSSDDSLYAFSNLIKLYTSDFFHYLIGSISFFSYLVILVTIRKLPKNNTFLYQIIATILFLLLSIHFNIYKWNTLFIFYLLCSLFIFFSSKHSQLKYLSLLNIFFILLSAIGSANGLKISFTTETLSILIILDFIISYSYIRIYLRELIICSFLLFIIGFSNKILFTYRDLSKYELNHNTNIPKLSGIKSNISKIEALERLYSLKNLFSKNKAILIYPSAPLIYYILDIDTTGINTWINLLTRNEISTYLSEHQSKNYPEVIVKLKQNTRYEDWPLNNKSFELDRNIATISVIDNIVLRHYKLLYADANFLFYQLDTNNKSYTN